MSIIERLRNSCEDELDPDTVYAAADELERLQAKVAELEWYVGNLLARIHRDGGHHQAECGTEHSVRDADLIVAETYAKVTELEEENIQRLETSCQQHARIMELESEAQEQCRIIGMSGEREAGLLAKVAVQNKLIEQCEHTLRRHGAAYLGHQDEYDDTIIAIEAWKVAK